MKTNITYNMAIKGFFQFKRSLSEFQLQCWSFSAYLSWLTTAENVRIFDNYGNDVTYLYC